jgi:thiamine kinase-like enzyme
MMDEIGIGKTAKVYSDGQYAYKVFLHDVAIEDINYEMRIQSLIKNNTDLNVCQYHSLVDDQTIQMDLIKGISLADRIRKEKYKGWLEDFISLQTKVYQYKALGIPTAKDVFKRQILKSKLDEAYKDIALSTLESVDDQNNLCHFDFHPLNILFDGSTYMIIDWVNAKLANPILDIARTYIIFKQYMKRQANKYLRLICQKMDYEIQAVHRVLPLMAFLRVQENDDSSFEKELLQMIKS